MEVSVDTYIGRRNTKNYRTVEHEDVKLLVSNSLANHITNIELDCRKFLFMNRIKGILELQNGAVIPV